MSKIIKVQGKAYSFDFDFHASDGFTLTANLIKEWQGKNRLQEQNDYVHAL